MQKWKKRVIITDILSLYLALVLAVILRGIVHAKVIQTQAVWLSAHLIIFLPSLLFSLLAFYVAGLYDAKIVYDRTRTIALLIYAQLASAIFSVISFYALRTNLTPKLTIFFYVIFSIVIITITRNIIFHQIQNSRKAKAIFWGIDHKLLESLQVKHAPFDFIFVHKDEKEKIKELKYSYFVYDEKLLDLDASIFIEGLKEKGKAVFSYNQYFEFLHRKSDLDNLFYDDLIRNISESKETIAHYIFRRAIDIVCGILIFPFFILSLPFIYLGIYMQDKGGVFSVQERVGFLGKNVKIYKIRTMTSTDVGGIVSDDKNKNTQSKFGNVVTPFGKFLRKTRLDELPQCVNLILGDISAIGPRADIIGVHNDMKKNIDNYSLRLLVPQGLTGWAQVHMNFPPRTALEHKERLAYELYYIRNRSILLDFSVILKTIKTLLSREGA